ncbi:MAG TPA: SDR family oxidoreductase [Thermoplasmata archaeon]|nr:SDR family oxidoreductase [Thermoplasmata archaeon]HEV2428654.1 SDR family oxidoreductase [Thermoplasmata archaeon]
MTGRPPDRFRGQGAVVTGASKGIGRAIAQELGRVGFRLLLVARPGPALERTTNELADAGVEAHPIGLDLADPGAAERVRAAAESAFRGPPYALVNNAGIAVAGRFERLPAEALDRMVAVDLVAPIRLSRAFLPDLLAAGRGHLVHLSSGAADFPPPGLALYATMKSALRSFSVALDLEYRRRGIRSTSIEPTYVRTDLGRRPGDAEAPLEALARRHPRWVLEPRTVARAVERALRSPRARVPVPAIWGPISTAGRIAWPIARHLLEVPGPGDRPGLGGLRPLAPGKDD